MVCWRRGDKQAARSTGICGQWMGCRETRSSTRTCAPSGRRPSPSSGDLRPPSLGRRGEETAGMPARTPHRISGALDSRRERVVGERGIVENDGLCLAPEQADLRPTPEPDRGRARPTVSHPVAVPAFADRAYDTGVCPVPELTSSCIGSPKNLRTTVRRHRSRLIRGCFGRSDRRAPPERPSSPAGAACKCAVSRKTRMAAPVRCSDWLAGARHLTCFGLIDRRHFEQSASVSSDQVEPVPRPSLVVSRRGEEAIHDPGEGVGRPVRHKGLNLSGRRRQAGQVERSRDGLWVRRSAGGARDKPRLSRPARRNASIGFSPGPFAGTVGSRGGRNAQ